MTRAMRPAILVCFVIALGAPTLNGPFRNDDYPQLLRASKYAPWEFFVQGQQAIHSQHYGWSAEQSRPSNFYRPANQLTWWIDWHLFGWDVRGYHATNIAIHAVTVLCVYWIAAYLFGPASGFLAGVFIATALSWAALVGQSMDNRSDAVPGMFVAIALLLWVKRRRWYLLPLALALFSKETPVFIPVVFSVLTALRDRKLSWNNLQPLAVMGLYLIVRKSVLGGIGTWFMNPVPAFKWLLVSPLAPADFFRQNVIAFAVLNVAAIYVLWKSERRWLAAWVLGLVPLLILSARDSGRYTYPMLIFYAIWMASSRARYVVATMVGFSMLFTMSHLDRSYQPAIVAAQTAENIVQSVPTVPSFVAITTPQRIGVAGLFSNGLCEALLLRKRITECLLVLDGLPDTRVRRVSVDEWMVSKSAYAFHARDPDHLISHSGEAYRGADGHWRIKMHRRFSATWAYDSGHFKPFQ
ncbi:MAG: ArnT family glycosyltransferase [Candidatus Acidiferrales bacterium]